MGQCPSKFSPLDGGCVSDCPNEKGFEFRSENGQPRCVYKEAPEMFITLNRIGWIYNGGNMIPNLTVNKVKDLDPALHAKYVSEQERVTQELAIVYGKLEKDKKLGDAFRKLQDAENVRDQAPNAYQQARAAYYTLKEGDSWKEKERQRLLKAEVEPIAQKLVETRNEALRQYENQRKTVDVVNGLKDKVLSLKDEVKYAADTFKGQLNKVQDAINRERRGRVTETKVSIWDWMDTILNIAIVASLLYVIYLLYKKFANRPAQPPAVIIRG